MHKKRISLNSLKNFYLSANKRRGRTLLCFWGILVSKNFKQRRGKLHGFVEKIFYLTGPEKHRQGTILCYRKIFVGKNLWIRGKGYHDFPSKKFCLTVPKCFVGEHFGVWDKNFCQKTSCIGGWASRFCQNFLSHRTEMKSFVKEPFCFPENFWCRKKYMEKRGHITIFRRSFYVSQRRKIS